MADTAETVTQAPPARTAEVRRVTKKDQILAMYQNGVTDVADLAAFTRTRPSYVASVLHQAEAAPGYFDLYTSTKAPMNVYSKFFAGQLGFRDEPTARRSVDVIDRLYRQFGDVGDRAGQHHALVMALMMCNRARWTGKTVEADVFRRWLCEKLNEPVPEKR